MNSGRPRQFRESGESVQEGGIYTPVGREEMIDSEGIDPAEDGFMQGYEEAMAFEDDAEALAEEAIYFPEDE